MRNTVKWCGLAVVLLALVSACGPDKKHPQSVAGTPTSTVTETRNATLPVPFGLRLQTVEFVDADHGYAQFVGDAKAAGTAPRYLAAIFRTVDGGRHWTSIAHPRQVSGDPQMYAVDAQTLLLSVEPYGWYVTHDGGATFRHDPADPTNQYLPPEYSLINVAADSWGVECASGCRVVRTDARGVASPAPTQPTLPGEVHSAVRAGNAVWAVSMDGGGRVYTAISNDQGRSWQRREVPAPDGGGGTTGYEMVDVRASADGADVWLVGYPRSSVGGGAVGESAPLRLLKVTGMPVLWRVVGDAWVAKGGRSRPTGGAQWGYSVAAIGGGLAAVAWPEGLALVDDGWTSVEVSPKLEWVTGLSDGTVFGSAISHGAVYLGSLRGRELVWVRVQVAPES